MKTMMLCMAILWGVLSITEPALASCTTSTIFVNGKMLNCITCGTMTTCN
jgi:hypothetical protein